MELYGIYGIVWHLMVWIFFNVNMQDGVQGGRLPGEGGAGGGQGGAGGGRGQGPWNSGTR